MLILEWKFGMYQRDNNPTKEQKKAEGHHWVFNLKQENPVPGGVLQLAPK